ncbi:Six-hairpin glycosidase [Venustampulla echinocandica]|uniref:Six-hairpin glycosidase n=1 Tax=Venustampulla echinocandica TaxID=2656787 RepID=A0A370TF71_9HELO|nr:Six-hairpin glycosidase [Venustampulla echinocandica]RDL33336.1 Six-hairpin glycosidase [Venustampulla echinocandica]
MCAMFTNGNRNRPSLLLFFVLYILALSGVICLASAALGNDTLPLPQQPTVALNTDQKPIRLPSETATPEPEILPAFLDALDVLQTNFFEPWQGIWPTAIDWTAAVLGTYVSAALTTISKSSKGKSNLNENLINRYFSQLVASYFGQDTFALRQEAYDDMLWVVLGWLESIKFINVHSALHYSTEPWYGTMWTPVFAHRARLFWDLASRGWNTSLCSGGMIWSPYLEPYKNAITNELYVTASISMYLFFPGDNNTAPFAVPPVPSPAPTGNPPGRPRDPKYLAAAIKGYKWLKDSNMTDLNGLYVDGYHVSGWKKNSTTGNTRCDMRNEMVYTYNQGVLLSGQRGLYEATGSESYLKDGHALVRNVIAATGWDLKSQSHRHGKSDGSAIRQGLGKWYGLGRQGVLEEACDASGSCSQDGQTFKGIFFHHLALLCAQLPDRLTLLDEGFASSAYQTAAQDIGVNEKVRNYHSEQCDRYGPWIKHNAKSALHTRNEIGEFGMWWNALRGDRFRDGDDMVQLPDDAVDYRNLGVPDDWKGSAVGKKIENMISASVVSLEHSEEVMGGEQDTFNEERGVGVLDLNDRGRGRTVETQGGGLSVLRALWEVVDRKGR